MSVRGPRPKMADRAKLSPRVYVVIEYPYIKKSKLRTSLYRTLATYRDFGLAMDFLELYGQDKPGYTRNKRKVHTASYPHPTRNFRMVVAIKQRREDVVGLAA